MLPYDAETRTLTKAEIHHLEAARHKWLRILNISWKDMHNDSICTSSVIYQCHNRHGSSTVRAQAGDLLHTGPAWPAAVFSNE